MIGSNVYGENNHLTVMKDVEQVALGYYHSGVLFDNGKVDLFGTNKDNQIR